MGHRNYIFEEINKEPCFNWLAMTKKEEPEPKKIIRLDLFAKGRNLCLPKLITSEIMKVVRKYVRNSIVADTFINVEMQKVYEHNPDGHKDRTYYILSVTVKYTGDNPWKQKVNVEIRNVQNYKKLYRVCRNYCTNELQKIIALQVKDGGAADVIVLTNGLYYILLEGKSIKKVSDITEATTFPSCNVAVKEVFAHKNKCKGYYPYDTEDITCPDPRTEQQKRQRRMYTQKERSIIYKKDNGKCYLCGKELLYSEMTLDHVMPLAKGGADCMENLRCCCVNCNRWKADSYSGDFEDKISNIYMHQMNDKIGNKFMWRFVKRYLDKQMTELYSRAQD